MQRMLALMVVLVLLSAGAAYADSCQGCDEAKEARGRFMGTPTNVPEKGQVCFYLKMPDPCDSVAREIHTENRVEALASYRVGAVVVNAEGHVSRDTSGKPVCRGDEKAMVCFPRAKLTEQVTEIRVIPGNQGTCHRLVSAEIKDLLARGGFPPKEARRLGWAAVGSNSAPQTR